MPTTNHVGLAQHRSGGDLWSRRVNRAVTSGLGRIRALAIAVALVAVPPALASIPDDNSVTPSKIDPNSPGDWWIGALEINSDNSGKWAKLSGANADLSPFLTQLYPGRILASSASGEANPTADLQSVLNTTLSARQTPGASPNSPVAIVQRGSDVFASSQDILRVNDAGSSANLIAAYTSTSGNPAFSVSHGGNVTATGFIGNGSQLTNISANNISGGTIPDAQLSSYVAMTNKANAFTANQAVNQSFSTSSDQTALTVNRTATGSANATGDLLRLNEQSTTTGYRAGNLLSAGHTTNGTYEPLFYVNPNGDASASSFNVGLTQYGEAQIQSGGDFNMYFDGGAGLHVIGDSTELNTFNGAVQMESTLVKRVSGRLWPNNDAFRVDLDGGSASYLINAGVTTSNNFVSKFNVNASGAVNAASFTGSGTGLTDLSATAITSGTIPDARLSNNVALANRANTFTANQTISNAQLSVTASTAAGSPALSASNSAGYGIYGHGTGSLTTSSGVVGDSTNGAGIYGASTNGNGVFGITYSSNGIAVAGQTTSGVGVLGGSANNYGLYAYSQNNTAALNLQTGTTTSNSNSVTHVLRNTSGASATGDMLLIEDAATNTTVGGNLINAGTTVNYNYTKKFAVDRDGSVAGTSYLRGTVTISGTAANVVFTPAASQSPVAVIVTPQSNPGTVNFWVDSIGTGGFTVHSTSSTNITLMYVAIQ